MAIEIQLRDGVESDLLLFFEQQLDPGANHMAAFTAKNPFDRDAFMTKWTKILVDPTIVLKTILADGQVAGSVLSHRCFGDPEVSYWLGKPYWGKGIATRALAAFLRHESTRPLFAGVAKDNIASLRVLQKCGFTIVREGKAFSNARGVEVEDYLLKLDLPVAMTMDRVTDLSDAERTAVSALTLTVYPPEQFEDWPGRNLEWSTHQWCVRIRQDSRLLSYVGAYIREAKCEGQPVRVGGIGNVKTHPDSRNQGLASRALKRALDFFEERRVDFAVLVCEPRLLSYYARLGWREFGGRLLVRQFGTVAEFTLCRAMTHGVTSEGPTGGTLDLCGPPW